MAWAISRVGRPCRWAAARFFPGLGFPEEFSLDPCSRTQSNRFASCTSSDLRCYRTINSSRRGISERELQGERTLKECIPVQTTVRSSITSCVTPGRRWLSNGSDAELGPKDAEARKKDHVSHLSTTPHLSFLDGRKLPTLPMLQLLDEGGKLVAEEGQLPVLSKDKAVQIYRVMVMLQVMDEIFYEAQRQGRISFYLTAEGEEAAIVASAAALETKDVVWSQYREAGVLLWRGVTEGGFTFEDFAHQCFGSCKEPAKGRQMPVHFTSKKLNFMTISSPLATQIPQAVGAAYALKLNHGAEARCSACYFGDGASSEGDFHSAMNFAATLRAPVLFLCRNNGWAISTSAEEQHSSDGVAGQAVSYGINTVRVDGNDTLAVYQAVSAARQLCVERGEPVLVEMMTYRIGHHSTSDDSTRYRESEAIDAWRQRRHPVTRFRSWIEPKGWWSQHQEEQLRKDTWRQVVEAMETAERTPKGSIDDLFTDVYHDMPEHLQEQREYVRAFAHHFPEQYNLNKSH
eukprot:jgi/Mesvir1/16135/Mv08412-RA.1